MTGTLRVRPWVWVAVTTAAVALLPVRAAWAQAQPAPSARYALVIEGVSGDDQYAAQHRQWLDGLVHVLRGTFGLDAAHVIVLAETPAQGEEKSTAENVKAVLGRLAKDVKPVDSLFVLLIGHGAGEGPDAKFNLVGPDLSIAEWNALLKPIPGHLTFVDTTSSSFPFLSGLAAPGRVIITATNSYAQHYHTEFPDAFIKALTSEEADADKNSRISMWEAFAYASRLVAQYYEQKGQLATEHAVLADTPDGKPRDGSATAQGGSLAGLTYLDAPAQQTSADPDVQGMIQRRDALTQQIDDLRRARSTMTPEAFDQAFEKLIIDLATVSRDIRRRTGGSSIRVGSHKSKVRRQKY